MDTRRLPGSRGTGLAPVIVDGLPFDPVTVPDVVAYVGAQLRAARGGLIVTPNVDILRIVRRNRLQELIRRADLVVADGMPVLWAARLSGQRLPQRVTGADLVWALSDLAAAQGLRVFLLGAGPGVAERAAAAFRNAYPGLQIAGTHCPPAGFEDDPRRLDDVRAMVEAADPHLVFIALGFPKQERLAVWLSGHRPATWFLGCGGAFDMAAGDLPRAHPLLRRLGAEWAHRLVLEPRRMARRYLINGVPFLAAMLWRALLRRGQHA